MNWFRSLIYGLVAGAAEFLPISSGAHQAMLRQLLGVDGTEPVRDLLVHIAMLLALLTCCKSMLHSLRREQEMTVKASRAGKRLRNVRSLRELRLLKTAAVPMLIGYLLLLVTRSLENNLVAISLFLLLNGFVLFLPERVTTGNKDARATTRLDSLLLGLASVLSVFPGISRIGAVTSAAILRGADRQHSLNWALLLSVPALGVWIGFDVLNLILQGGGVGFWQNLFGYLLSASATYAGSYVGITAIRSLVMRNSTGGFAYYSWGAGLFLFILYLQV